MLLQQQNLIINYAQVKTYYKKFDIINLPSYNDLNKIKSAFISAKNVNNKNFDFNKINNSRFFILRSTCDDDIHKAIKYGIWSSSYKNNKLLNEVYLQNNNPIYLIYTVIGSNQFCGVAEMISEVDFNRSFPYWWDDLKWTGNFKIRWIYIKDVHYLDCKDIKQNLNDDETKPVTQLKDGTEISLDKGKELLKLFKFHDIGTSIFEAFSFMDGREEKLRLDRDNKLELIKKYKESNPDQFNNNNNKNENKFSKNYYNNNDNRNNKRSFKSNYWKKYQKDEVEYIPKNQENN